MCLHFPMRYISVQSDWSNNAHIIGTWRRHNTSAALDRTVKRLGSMPVHLVWTFVSGVTQVYTQGHGARVTYKAGELHGYFS